MLSPQQISDIHRLYEEGANKTEIANAIGVHRGTVRHILKTTSGPRDLKWTPEEVARIPVRDPLVINRIQEVHTERETFILTAAQNNTAIHEGFWRNLLAYAEHTDAQIMVGGFIYNKNALGQAGQEKEAEDDNEQRTKWDPAINSYRVDERQLIGPGLWWMGQINVLPTASNPLSSLESYSRADSAIFPHVKVALRSVATAPGVPTKFVYTTGAVTLPNYIQRKVGQVAEFHHVIGALIVEVDGDRPPFVRQLVATEDGSFQDLDAVVANGRVTTGHHLFAINWGDVHERKLSDEVFQVGWGAEGILATYRPTYQFFHDLVDAESANPHTMGDHLQRYALQQKNLDDVRTELSETVDFLGKTNRTSTVSVVVPSNHDDMIVRWLKSADHKKDPKNMRFYHEASLAALDMIDHNEGVDLVKWFVNVYSGRNTEALFIPPNKPTMVLKGIEFGQHGHIGPNGNRRPTAKQYAQLAIKVNKGHTHTADITDGVYTAGAMELEHGYNIGYSSWSRSLIFTYPNGKRSIVTLSPDLKHRR